VWTALETEPARLQEVADQWAFREDLVGTEDNINRDDLGVQHLGTQHQALCGSAAQRRQTLHEEVDRLLFINPRLRWRHLLVLWRQGRARGAVPPAAAAVASPVPAVVTHRRKQARPQRLSPERDGSDAWERFMRREQPISRAVGFDRLVPLQFLFCAKHGEATKSKWVSIALGEDERLNGNLDGNPLDPARRDHHRPPISVGASRQRPSSSCRRRPTATPAGPGRATCGTSAT
jgi:hypothetical protein